MMVGWIGSRSASVDDNSVQPRETDGVYAQLLEQAGDLNDELCRENCELRSEVSLLRQRQLRRMQKGVEAAKPAVPSRATKARALLPHAVSNVKSALRDLPTQDVSGAEGIVATIEEAVHGVLAAVAELGPSAALASDKETEALVAEKVALKEFCIRQQERLLELELAKEKASHSGNWALRMIQGTLADAGSAAPPPKTGEVVEAQSPPLVVNVGEECEVVGRKGAILRETEDLQSALVATVPPGGHVRILQVGSSARRALAEVVDSPEAQLAEGWSPVTPGACGWLSVSTKDGKALIRPLPTKQAEEVERPKAEVNRATASAQETQDILAGPAAQAEIPAPEAAASGDEGDVANMAAAQPDDGELTGGAEPLSTAEEVATETPALEEAPNNPVVPDSLDVPVVDEAPPSTGDDVAMLVDAGIESRPAEASAGAPRGSSVTVSTDAWLALRHERTQRERQIKAMQAQVASGQKEIQKLDEVRARLREERTSVLEVRQLAAEYQEATRMAEEEIRAVQCHLQEARSLLRLPDAVCADVDEGAKEAATEEEPERSAAGSAEEAGDADSVQPEPERPVEAAKEEGPGIEWRMLLSERETTARELASTLQKVEEMEKEVEDRKIELRIAERRRERERRSLLTALRELGASFRGEGSPVSPLEGGDALDTGVEEVDTSDGWMSSRIGGSWQSSGSSPSFRPPNPQESGAGTKEEEGDRHHLLRISECEEMVAKLREEIDAVQSRIAVLNQQAVTRQQALRFASTLPAAGALGDFGISRRSGRADLDALADLLGRLFVENFALRRRARGEVRGGGPADSNGQSRPPGEFAHATTSTPPLDLSRFVVREGETEAASDGEDEPPQVVPPFSSSQRLDPPAETAPQRSTPPGSPRTRLLGGLDFKALSVAE